MPRDRIRYAALALSVTVSSTSGAGPVVAVPSRRPAYATILMDIPVVITPSTIVVLPLKSRLVRLPAAVTATMARAPLLQREDRRLHRVVRATWATLS